MNVTLSILESVTDTILLESVTVGIFDQFFYRIHTYTKQETEKSIKENDFPTRSNSHLTLLLFFFFSFLARIPGFLSLVGWSNHCKWVMENLANQP